MLLDKIHPEHGWLIAPIAALSNSESLITSVSQVLFGLSAIIYAVAVYRKSRPQIQPEPPCLTGCPHSRFARQSPPSTPKSPEDTVDVTDTNAVVLGKLFAK